MNRKLNLRAKNMKYHFILEFDHQFFCLSRKVSIFQPTQGVSLKNYSQMIQVFSENESQTIWVFQKKCPSNNASSLLIVVDGTFFCNHPVYTLPNHHSILNSFYNSKEHNRGK
jgi:hypothetical protein